MRFYLASHPPLSIFELLVACAMLIMLAKTKTNLARGVVFVFLLDIHLVRRDGGFMILNPENILSLVTRYLLKCCSRMRPIEASFRRVNWPDGWSRCG